MKIVALFWLLLASLSSALAADSNKDKPAEPPEVFVQKISEEELYNPLSFGGFVEAKDRRHVGPEIRGTVNKVFVDLGQRVKRGQLLFNLRPQGAGHDYRLNRVSSPISGVITEVIRPPGEFIEAGEGVVVVADASELEVEIQVTYDDLPLIEVGKQIDVVLTGPDKQEIAAVGTVQSVSPAAHPDLGTFPVEVNIDCTKEVNCHGKFRIGTFVRVIFKSNFRKGIKVDPKYLVNQRRKAIIVGDNNTAKFVEVKLGGFLGNQVEVLEGLKPGDLLITNFSKFPKEDEKVLLKNKDEEKKRIYSSGSPAESVEKS